MPSSLPFHPGRVLSCTFALLVLLLCVRRADAIDLGRVWPTVGAGAVAKEARVVGHFRGVSLNTGARVVIRQGDHDAVEVEAEANVRPLIDAYVDAGTLVIEDVGHFSSPSAAVVVTARRITAIRTAGSTAVVGEGLNATSLSLSMGGASTLKLSDVSVTKLSAALGGSSALKISGKADELSSELGGSASVQATELAAKSVTVSGGGSSRAIVWASDSLRIALGGSAAVSHYGVASPTQATAGSATVKYLGPAPPKRP